MSLNFLFHQKQPLPYHMARSYEVLCLLSQSHHLALQLKEAIGIRTLGTIVMIHPLKRQITTHTGTLLNLNATQVFL
jgi:hypothetical protein